MFKIGKVVVYQNGRRQIPPDMGQFMKTFVYFTLPVPILYYFYYYSLSPFYLNYVIFVLYSVIYLITIGTLIDTGTRDPGLIPPANYYVAVCDAIEKVFEYRQEQYDYDTDKNQNNFVSFSTPLYKVLTLKGDSSNAIKMVKHDKQLNAFRFCRECAAFKPYRTCHSSRSKCCVMRFDHFCPWIGNDVGLYNHFYFYTMVAVMFTHVIFASTLATVAFVISFVQLFVCHVKKPKLLEYAAICYNYTSTVFETPIIPMYVFVCAIIFSFAFGAMGLYFVDQVRILLRFHTSLQKTGTMTVEQIGTFSSNFQQSAQYSLLQRKLNFKDIMINAKNKFTPLSNTQTFVNLLYNLLKKDKSLVNFVQLQKALLDSSQMADDMQFSCEFSHIMSCLDEEWETFGDYEPQFIKSDNITLNQYIGNLLAFIKGQVAASLQLGDHEQIQKHKQMILQQLYVSIIVSMVNKVPFYTHKLVEPIKPYTIFKSKETMPVFCVNSMLASIASCCISRQMIRCTDQQIEEFREQNKELLSKGEEAFNFATCSKKALNKQDPKYVIPIPAKMPENKVKRDELVFNSPKKQEKKDIEGIKEVPNAQVDQNQSHVVQNAVQQDQKSTTIFTNTNQDVAHEIIQSANLKQDVKPANQQ